MLFNILLPVAAVGLSAVAIAVGLKVMDAYQHRHRPWH